MFAVAQAAVIRRFDCRDAIDRINSANMVLSGQSRQFRPYDRIHQRRLVGDCAECSVFPCGFFMFSKAAFLVDCALRELCSVDCRRDYPSVAA